MAKDRKPGQGRFRKRYVFYGIIAALAVLVAIRLAPPRGYDLLPHAGSQAQAFHLDPTSPWPKFRANALENGRATVGSRLDPAARPWTYPTGKGIFSSPVVDAEGTVYVGSADHVFYAIRRDGSLKWTYRTGEIIDSSALLDDRGRVYFGSGDQHVYCLDRETGALVWTFKAHSPEEVTKDFGVETHNVAWFEGNVGILPDGSLLAPDDNCIVYAIDRDTGKAKAHYAGNEMVWSLPAVNATTGRLFFGTTYLAATTVFAYDAGTGKKLWTAGGLGSVAATPLLTNDSAMGALVVGSFDGYVRAYAQDSGRQLWAFGARDHIYASPAQLADGTIIQPAADGTVYALDPKTGRLRWAFDTLEPIRSSPAVGGDGLIYVGSGEGRLFCITPEGRLRWAYRCIEDDRNDLNASPALGRDGVYVAGESGGIFFVPYDYPLSNAGRADPRCSIGPGEDLPAEGALLLRTTRFGALETAASAGLDANEPLTFTLMLREKGDTVLTALDRDSVKVTVSGNPSFKVAVAANRRFLSLIPREYWTGPEGGDLTVRVQGSYHRDLSRLGLKFFGGRLGGSLDETFTFSVPPRVAATASTPGFSLPETPGAPQSAFELSRLAAPNPTMLPSWNQIGFDSLHYLAGLVSRLPNGPAPAASTAQSGAPGAGPERYLAWVVGGRKDAASTAGGSAAATAADATVADPSLGTRYPLVIERDGDLLTIYNYDGFKISFVGSWDMPFGLYRIASRDPSGSAAPVRASFSAVALCDEIKFYGLGLKLMGLTEADTGRMTVAGGLNLSSWAVPKPVSVNATFSAGASSARVEIARGAAGLPVLKGADHVYGLLLVDEASGNPLPLYYSRDTKVECDASGALTAVSLSYRDGQVTGKVRAYLMVDTYPAAEALLDAPPSRKGAAALLSSPPELTTAATDGLLGVLALVLGLDLLRKRRSLAAGSEAGRGLWGAVLLAAAAVSLLGVPAHALRAIAGLAPPDLAGQARYWAFLGIALFGMTALTGTAALRDAFGRERVRGATATLWVVACLAWLVYAAVAITGIIEGYFVIFVAFSAVVMALALAAYLVLFARTRDPSHLLTAAAIAVAITGSLVQAMRAIHFTLVWDFDYNSVYHAFMAVAVVLFHAGASRLRKG